MHLFNNLQYAPLMLFFLSNVNSRFFATDNRPTLYLTSDTFYGSKHFCSTEFVNTVRNNTDLFLRNSTSTNVSRIMSDLPILRK